MIGVVVVTFNSADVIQRCVEACLKIPNASIVVIDNASRDGTAGRIPRHPNVRVIRNRKNVGFGAAVNQGFSALEGAGSVLILNPDATPLDGIQQLADAVTSSNVAAATGRLLNQDGSNQDGFNVRALPTAWTLAFEVLAINRLWPGNPVNRRYRPQAPVHEADIEQPAGAFLMVRRNAWAEIGGFDESYFPIWFEDVDFCKRLRERGYRLRYLPVAAAQHQGGHSASALTWGERQVFWYGSLLKYASKHMSGTSRRVVAFAVILACPPRMLAGIKQVGVREAVSIYRRVLLLAGRRLRKGERG